MGAPEWLAKACSKVQGQSTSGAGCFSQKAAAVALMSDMSPTARMREKFLERRDLVIDGLRKIPNVKVNHPTGAFYVFPDISAYFGKSNGTMVIDDANDFVELMLEDAHVAMVSGSAFGNNDCVRLSYAASEDKLIEAIKRMAESLSKFS